SQKGAYYYYDSVKVSLAMRTRDAGALEAVLRAKANSLTGKPSFFDGSGPSMSVPDLVAILGVERGRALLTYILHTAKAELTFYEYGGESQATVNLARQIVEQQTGQLAWPQWTLAESSKVSDLFLTFRKRFPTVKKGISIFGRGGPTSYDGAATACLIDLFAAGNTQRAKEFVVEYKDVLGSSMFGRDESSLEPLGRSGRLGAFLNLIAQSALQYPDSNLADFYMNYARGRESQARIERFLKRLAAVGPMQEYRRQSIKSELQSIYLSQGKLSEVASMLLAAEPSNEDPFGSSSERPKLLLALAAELHQSDLLKRGLDVAQSSLRAGSFDEDLLGPLIANGRGPAVEKLLIDDLRKAGNGDSSGAVIDLVRFYNRVGRFHDVVTLLERYPNWGAPDLFEVRKYVQGDWSIFHVAARALAKTGRTAEALRIVRYDLTREPGLNEEYALLLDIDPKGAAETIDALHRQFPTETQPVIWKAALLLRAGKLAAAEAMARRAIAMDPCDLEAGDAESRFMAYGVLGDIERAKGNAGKAQRLRRYLLGAQLSAKASAFGSLGLSQQEIALYRKDLTFVPDDFKSRFELATLELQNGHEVDAKKQIAIACRYLPAKFGSSTSYQITLPYASPIREMVKAELGARIKRGSASAGIYAYLGNLRGFDADSHLAIQCFRNAVRLDPDCVVAWSELSRMSDQLPDDECRNVYANLVRLGARTRNYASPRITDYRQCWLDAAQSANRRIPAVRALFELPASRNLLSRSSDPRYADARLSTYGEEDLGPPAETLTGDRLVSSISNLIGSLPANGS
ncbi:MAG: hypothetical protein ACHQ50_11210, partial [Fimbriimonadales bacterium]